MKKFKSVIAAAMAVTMALTMTACDEEVAPNGSGSGGGNTPPSSNGTPPAAGGDSSASEETPAATVKSEYTDEKVVEVVTQLKDQLEEPDMKVEKRIKWLAWYPTEESGPAGELFKSVYGIPATGDIEDFNGRIFEWVRCDYADRYDKLATSIQSNDSPDLFPFEGTDFPYGIVMNRYQDVGSILDLTSDKWKNAKDLMEQFKINGKYYCAFWEITLGSLMWYKKSAIADIGADDPQELFKQGLWDWDHFIDLGRKWQQSGTDESPRYLYDGWGAEDNFLLSAGVPIVSNDGGKLKSNLHDANLERAIAFIDTLVTEKLYYPRHEVNSYSINPKAWCNNSNLFFCVGVWGYGGTGWTGEKDDKTTRDGLKDYRIMYNWPADEIKVVPFPKDPKSDKHYVQLKQDSFMWCKGSTNRNGVKAWIDCCATAALDPKTTEAAKQQSIDDPSKQWTAELLDFLYPLYKLDGTSPVTPIVEYKTGLGPSVYDSQKGESPVPSLTNYMYLGGEDTSSFVQLRDTHEPAINAAIDDLNARLS